MSAIIGDAPGMYPTGGAEMQPPGDPGLTPNPHPPSAAALPPSSAPPTASPEVLSPLPPEWTTHTTATGREWFHNKHTGVSSYTRPTVSTSPTAPTPTDGAAGGSYSAEGKPRAPSPSDAPVCSRCGEAGHLIKDCRLVYIPTT
eukprot:RCo005293